MKPFWREDELTPEETKLFGLVLRAHAASALRNNVSTVALKHAAAGSGRIETALIAALASVGGVHAPIAATTAFLSNEPFELVQFADQVVTSGGRVPGWGNSFFKGKPDPDWQEVGRYLFAWPDMDKKIQAVTELLHSHDKKIFPNAGCYTAATAIVLGMPPKLAPYLLLNKN